MVTKVGQWVRDNIAIMVAAISIMGAAALVIAEQAATDSVDQHNKSEAVHATLAKRVTDNSTQIKVITAEIRLNNEQQTKNLDRFERAIERFEKRLDEVE